MRAAMMVGFALAVQVEAPPRPVAEPPSTTCFTCTSDYVTFEHADGGMVI
jgi:hypothetical protein